ncbi:Gfo/Idh/MocA family protein [Gemmatimonas groenlandica]|uniref:Gfo/Idh/MocA family oxidoreductase n=1 Tax=Gemmatimonas groenlandica TaxID=2732249 RepID=A0A6M4IT85_9BACT|nr:Gfo/Idh/MocA family oxidoreductase [Gemmatimonas groenlandica]QJR37328.1 Gfo/Idh/MocA family oxidoreductase [Gemmatimonas groenlandica]
MSHAPIGALIVGAGLMGRAHAHAITASGGVVVGVVDPDPLRASALAGTSGRVPVFADVASALQATTPTVVHVCTPLPTHRAVIEAALHADCHVIGEKPLTATAPEAEALCALAAARGRHLVPVHQFPFQQGVGDLLAKHDALGTIVHVELTIASAGASGPRDADDVVAEILPHCLSLTQVLLPTSHGDASHGDASHGDASLNGLPWQVTRVSPGEWRITAHANTASIAYLISMSARPTCAELRVFGTTASAVVDLFHGYSVIDTGAVTRASKAARPFRVAGRSMVAASANLARRGLRAESAYPGLQALVHRAYLAFAGRGDVPISPRTLLDVARARDRLIALSGWTAP